MNELENRLQRKQLAGPSAALDRRVAALLHAASTQAIRPRASRQPWWLVTAFAATAAAMMFVVTLGPGRSEPAPVVYRIEANTAVRDLLLGPVPPPPFPPFAEIEGGS